MKHFHTLFCLTKMKFRFTCIFIHAICCSGFAQNKSETPPPTYSSDDCTLAFYAQDSVAMRMKGFKPLFDTAAAMQKRLSVLQEQSFAATDKMLVMTPDSGEVLNAAEINALD